MPCETIRENLNRMSDGERLDDWRQEAAVLRHCLRCASCRAYRRQCRRIRALSRNLPSHLPASLQDNVLAQLAGQKPDLHPTEDANLPKFTLTKEMQMRKRLTIATCATLAVALTGALAAQIFRPNASAVIEDRDGRQWHIRSNFPNQVKLYNQYGELVGIAGNHQHKSGSAAMVELDVEGAHYQLHPGRQAIQDGKGAKLGYAEMIPDAETTPLPKSNEKTESLIEALRHSEEDEAKYGGVSGLSASVLGAHGWDKALGVDWKIRGQVKVRVFDAAHHAIGTAEGVPLTSALRQQLGAANLPPATPIWKVVINGTTHSEEGYGIQAFRNKAGKTVLRLEVAPLVPTVEATSVPDSNTSIPTH